MMSNDHFVVPDEVELLEFFGVEPAQRSVEDGFWCYEVDDVRGIRLRFSFNLFERSVQTSIVVADSPVITVAHEEAREMKVSAQTLICRFASEGSETTLVVRVAGSINVEWSTLRTSA